MLEHISTIMKVKLIQLYFLNALLLGLPAVGQVESMLNGGFETGDLTNWILAGDYTYTYLDGGSEFVPHSGSYEALLGNNTAPGTRWRPPRARPMYYRAGSTTPMAIPDSSACLGTGVCC